MPAPPAPTAAYLRAATAGLRHHRRHGTTLAGAPARAELDPLHAHLVTLHTLVDQLVERARADGTPAHTAHLIATRTRLWQAAVHLHDAFHTARRPGSSLPDEDCPVQSGTSLLDPPAVLTLCQRHQSASTTVRRQTTPADLHDPLHGHIHHPAPGAERGPAFSPGRVSKPVEEQR